MAITALTRFRQQGASISHNVRMFLWMVLLSNIGVSGVFLLLYNLYLVELGYKEDFIGLLALVQTGAIALGAIPAGSLSERYGSRRVMIVGTVIIGLSSVGMCLVNQAFLLALFNFLMGAGFSMRIIPYTPFLVNNTTAVERTLVFAANSAAISLAGTAGNLLGGQLPALFTRLMALPGATSVPAYRLSLLVGAAIGLVAALPMVFASEITHFAENPNGTPAMRGVRAHLPTSIRRATIMFVIVTTLFALSSACIGPFANVYFSRVLGLRPSSISFAFSLSAILAAAATVASSSIADRIGKVRAMLIIRSLGMPLLFFVAFSHSVGLGITAVIMRNVTEMSGWPLDGAFLADVIPVKRQARVSAFRSIAWNATWALAAFAAGQVIVRFGYTPLFIVAGVVGVAAVLTYHFAFSHWESAMEPA